MNDATSFGLVRSGLLATFLTGCTTEALPINSGIEFASEQRTASPVFVSDGESPEGDRAPTVPPSSSAGRRWRLGAELTVGLGSHRSDSQRLDPGSRVELSSFLDWRLTESTGLIAKWGTVSFSSSWALLDERFETSNDVSPESFAFGLRYGVSRGRVRAHAAALAVHREREVPYRCQVYGASAWGGEFAFGVTASREHGTPLCRVELGYTLVETMRFTSKGEPGDVSWILPATGEQIRVDDSGWIVRVGILF